VSIVGSKSIQIRTSQSLTVLGAAQLSGCSGAFTSLSYRWAINLNEAPVLLNSTSVNPRQLSLPAYSLQSDLTYEAVFTVIAIVEGKSVASSSEKVTVFVQSSPVVALISGTFCKY